MKALFVGICCLFGVTFYCLFGNNPKVVICHAPLCNDKTEISAGTHGLCPEHMERISAGRISDNDPTTNPDLI